MVNKGGCYVLNVELLAEIRLDRPIAGFTWQA